MFRSVEKMTNTELIFLLRNSFLLGFSIGSIGTLCMLLSVIGKQKNMLIFTSTTVITLLLVLVLSIIYRRISSELARRI